MTEGDEGADYLCPPRGFDKPFIKKFFAEGQEMGELILQFRLSG